MFQCRLGLIGDLGQTEDSAQTLEHLDALDVASVLDVGDLSYADSYQPRWDSYGRLLEVHLLPPSCMASTCYCDYCLADI